MSEVKRGALQSPADTVRTTDTIVYHTQNVGADGIATPSGDASDPVYVAESSPLDAHILDDTLLDAVTATANSTYSDCTGMGGLTLHVIATGTVNATIQVNHADDSSSTTPASVGLIDAGGTPSATPITLSAAGEYVYSVDIETAKYLRGRAVITTGTITMVLYGRALGK